MIFKIQSLGAYASGTFSTLTPETLNGRSMFRGTLYQDSSILPSADLQEKATVSRKKFKILFAGFHSGSGLDRSNMYKR